MRNPAAELIKNHDLNEYDEVILKNIYGEKHRQNFVKASEDSQFNIIVTWAIFGTQEITVSSVCQIIKG